MLAQNTLTIRYEQIPTTSPGRTNPIPIKNILTDSCYYPSSGLDASPIIILNGFLHSFVLVDYSVEREGYLEEISSFGFKGYKQILARDIEKEEIVPLYMIPHLAESRSKVQSMGLWGEDICLAESFCHWSIWQRKGNGSVFGWAAPAGILT